MKVKKRDGKIVDFDVDKIRMAINQANREVPVKHRISKEEIESIVDYVASQEVDTISVEHIQDIIEQQLMKLDKFRLAKHYITYRYKHDLLRKSNTTDKDIMELLAGDSDYWNNENSNKNARVVTTQRDYLAGITSTDITRRLLLPKDIIKAHDKGIIHIHDADYYIQPVTNCCLINLEDMLQNGTVINNIKIDKPKRVLTASTVATQILTAVTSSQFGGTTITLTHLAPFVRDSYNYYLKKYRDYGLPEEDVLRLADIDIKKEVKDAVQTFNYQVNSMSNTNGQSPFLSVFMYLSEDKEYTKEVAMLIEEFLNQRILGMKNKKGVYISPAFPKLLYVLEEQNIHKDSKYYYLTELAAKCTAKRLVPDYISEKIMFELKDGNCFGPMGCRSFLSPYYDENGKPKFYGRFNIGVTTLSLPDVALSSKGDFDKFWKLMDERTELCHKSLKLRYERLLNTTSDVAPILWQYGALARLEPGEKISKLFYNGYATISLGYAGLYECVKYMTGNSHTDGGVGEKLAFEIMNYLNDKCNKWKAEENVGYSVYGTPLESTTYKFAKCLRKRFGEIKGITDRYYITNSYHVPVFEEINAFDKIKLEGKFQSLSVGGSVNYIETSNLQNNLDAILEIIKYMYDNTMYAELNTKSDYCQKCGYDGEMLIDENMNWYCPNCGNRDKTFLNVCRRVCGYLSTNFFNYGRTQEIKERYVHIDNKDL